MTSHAACCSVTRQVSPCLVLFFTRFVTGVQRESRGSAWNVGLWMCCCVCRRTVQGLMQPDEGPVCLSCAGGDGDAGQHGGSGAHVRPVLGHRPRARRQEVIAAVRSGSSATSRHRRHRHFEARRWLLCMVWGRLREAAARCGQHSEVRRSSCGRHWSRPCSAGPSILIPIYRAARGLARIAITGGLC